MGILKDHAQVLHVYEQGNTSLVVVFLGRRLGQFRAHAKGARRWQKKGFEAGFDLLARGEILVYPRGGEALWLVKEWDEHARPALGRGVAQLRLASFLCELAEALTRQRAGSSTDATDGGVASGHSNAPLYDAMAEAADKLASGAAPGPLVLQFTLKALHAEGLLPDLRACGECGRRFERIAPQEWPARLTAEGLACRPCAAKTVATKTVAGQGHSAGAVAAISPDAWRALRHIGRNGTSAAVRPQAAAQLARALLVLVHGALEHDLRTLQAAARAVRAISPASMSGKDIPAC